MTTMVYKAGGPHKLHDLMCEYAIVEDVESAIADGWALSPAEAHAAPTGLEDAIDAMDGQELKEALEQHGVTDIPRRLDARRDMLRKIVYISDEELQ